MVFSMVFRLCFYVVLLCACGYATKSSDYCRVVVNYDTFKTSVDNLLASMDKTCGNSDVRSESKATCLKTMSNRVNDLEKKVENLLNDNENKETRLSYLESAIANLTSELNVDCGSPNPLEDTDVDYSSTRLHAIANYRCRKGFLSIHDKVMSFCQKNGNWTKVTLKCVNSKDVNYFNVCLKISKTSVTSCWIISGSRVVYTGTQSTTTSGKTCQRWDAQEPHSHGYNVDGQFIIPGFDTLQTVTGSANYCRDPSRSGYLWCYTMNSGVAWEKCDVPMCYMSD